MATLMDSSYDEYDVTDERDEEGTPCPLCSGTLCILGTLGSLTWYSCRNCGMQFSSNEARG